MDDDVVKTAVGLCLSVPLCHPHLCHHWKQEVDELATHDLSCIKSEGCYHGHAAINSIMQRSLAAAQIPSTLEPTSLIGYDGQRSDGVTITPWKFAGHLSGMPPAWTLMLHSMLSSQLERRGKSQSWQRYRRTVPH